MRTNATISSACGIWLHLQSCQIERVTNVSLGQLNNFRWDIREKYRARIAEVCRHFSFSWTILNQRGFSSASFLRLPASAIHAYSRRCTHISSAKYFPSELSLAQQYFPDYCPRGGSGELRGHAGLIGICCFKVVSALRPPFHFSGNFFPRRRRGIVFDKRMTDSSAWRKQKSDRGPFQLRHGDLRSRVPLGIDFPLQPSCRKLSDRFG